MAFFVLLLISGVVQATQVPGPLVETNWLSENLSKVAILDVRGDIQSFTTEPKFVKNKKTGKQQLVRIGGHIPNARLINYKDVRADRKIGEKTIKKSLPEKSAFEKLLQNAGINKDDAIVIVSKGASGSDIILSTRLYWQIKYYGHDNLSILNGGMAQWLLENRKVSTKPSKVISGDWVATAERDEILATSDEVAAASKESLQLVDIRPISQYIGTSKSSSVSKYGHITGAKNFPTELLFKSGFPATLTSNKIAEQLINALDIEATDNKIAYCNTGNMASAGWFFFSEILGFKNTQLYDGSLHQWTLEERPTVTMVME